MSNKIDELFRKVILEDAKEQSKLLEEQKKALNRNPIYTADPLRIENLMEEKLEKKDRFSWNFGFIRMPRRASFTVAAVVLILLAVFIPLTSTAARAQISELIVSITSRFTNYTLFDPEGWYDTPHMKYRPGYVPEGYTLVEDFDSGGIIDLYYENAEGQYFNVGITVEGGTVQVDTENAEIEPIIIQGVEGTILTKQDRTHIIWTTNERIFEVVGTINRDEIIKIAESLQNE